MKLILTSAALVALSLSAQTAAELFDKAPPEVDAALRARVTKYYQAHVDGKFRAADAFVAEESKDTFFAADKTKYRGFEIGRIIYSDRFLKAVVAVVVDTNYETPFGIFPVKMPVASRWKQVDGEWFWYVEPPPKGQVRTLFGTFNLPEAGASGGKPATGGGLGPMPDPAILLGQVKADRSDVVLAGSSSVEVVISNLMPGVVTLSVEIEGSWTGLAAKLDRTELKTQESARLAIEHKGSSGPPSAQAVALVRVDPTRQVIPIKINYTAARQ